MKIAIIGTGISGLGLAFLLNPHHDITVYEKNPVTGGHSRTVDLVINNRHVPVDTGFIVFNYRNYPLLSALFAHLDVPVQKSDMSFGASIANGWMEYSSKNLLGQKRNALRPSYWRMMVDILRFNRTAEKILASSENPTLSAYLKETGMGTWFAPYYLEAMGGAIWSCPRETIRAFPAKSFVQFFQNHGLLTVNDHPQWYTVCQGSRTYVEKLTASFQDRIRTLCTVHRIKRTGTGQVTVHDSRGGCETYDHVVLACHADEALALIESPDSDHSEILGAIPFQKNSVVLHSDPTFMPRRKSCWASWIYLSETREDSAPCVSLSYWMNALQKLDTDTPVFVTLNPARPPDPALTYDRHVFTHPVFTHETLRAQKDLPQIQGKDGIWYCGAWQRYGFHEDGLWSAVKVAEAFGVTPPWQ